MKKILFILFAWSILGYTQSLFISRTQVIMGTFCTIKLETQYEHTVKDGFLHLKHLESILSSYQEDALVSQLNKTQSISSHPILKDILEQSIAYHETTLGYFDITIGSITKKLYYFGETEVLPTLASIRQAPIGLENILIQDKAIHLKDNITIDLGGIGKGYAIDSLSRYYHNRGIHKGKIALSGDIQCLNTCKVAIQDPFSEDKRIVQFRSKVKNLSISTSGTYRRYIENKKNHHLINPKTKRQGNDFISVTIISQNNNTLCDVMATAIATMPKKIALDFVKSQKDFGYLLITPQGEKIQGNLDYFVDFIDTPQ